MYKVIILAVVCFTIINGTSMKDQVKEALNQGEKVKVC
jgi:hypothetical protein